MIKTVAIASSLLALASAECPNGCSSHGKCTAYDMCLCYRNWMSNDCSERVCQFGLAHVDTPKGDLDASSGALDGTDVEVALNSEMYPYGTTEQFPAMVVGDTYLDNTAHYYMECSNKGICDREAGSCECFPGYDGSACQRASCPVSEGLTCGGHGTCETIKQIAAADSNNIYELWDEKATMGCVCDAGYYGADCALRECKFGADPLYFDDGANIRYSNWTVAFATSPTTTADIITGTYSITFYDHHGEDWETGPLAPDATCDDLITALEDIPNDVIPDDSVLCYKHNVDDAGGEDPALNQDVRHDAWLTHLMDMTIFSRYTLLFPENPGTLKEIRLNKYLDGNRPTLYTIEADKDLQMWVFTDGFSGEDDDMVPDECEDVLVQFAQETTPTAGVGANDYYYLEFTDPDVQETLFKRCLGDANNDQSFAKTVNEVESWDYGSHQNPHLVKFINDADDVVSHFCHSLTEDYALLNPIVGDVTHQTGWCYESAPAGFYAPIIYGQATNVNLDRFVVYSNAPKDYDTTATFRVYTTTGYLNRVSPDSEVFTKTDSFADLHSDTLYTIQRENTITRAELYGDGTDVDGYSAADVASLPAYVDGADGHIDCETTTVDDITQSDCLQKGDRVMFFTTEGTTVNYDINPRYHNMYTVQKIYKEYPLNPDYDANEADFRNRIVLDMHVNFKSEQSTTATGSVKAADSRLRAYKFYPPAVPVNYVSECSGRGLCDSDSGICDCFVGYTKDDCSIQA